MLKPSIPRVPKIQPVRTAEEFDFGGWGSIVYCSRASAIIPAAIAAPVVGSPGHSAPMMGPMTMLNMAEDTREAGSTYPIFWEEWRFSGLRLS
jgi:hypothetical protein